MRLLLALLLSVVIVPTQATAFCGFFVSGADANLYNDASQVVLMRKGNRTVMSMSNNYKGPAADFAMVVPVPVVLQEKQVKTLAPSVFDKVDQLSAPRLVEYWEKDPCHPEVDRFMAFMSGAPTSAAQLDGAGALGVTIEAKFSVGEYEIVILSANEANGLDTWLRRNQYNIPEGAAEAQVELPVEDLGRLATAEVSRLARLARRLHLHLPIGSHAEAAQHNRDEGERAI